MPVDVETVFSQENEYTKSHINFKVATGIRNIICMTTGRGKRTMSKKFKMKQIIFAINCMIVVAFMSFLCGYTTNTIINNMIEDKFSSIPLVRVVPDKGNSSNTQ